MRGIPTLQVLCLRAIGSHSCSVEDAFAKSESGEPSVASRLLRSFHQRPIRGRPSQLSHPVSGTDLASNDAEDGIDSSKQKHESQSKGVSSPTNMSPITTIPMNRKPCIGAGAARRNQANEIDLNHPIIGCRWRKDPAAGTSTPAIDEDGVLFMEYGSVALDTLQSYIDSLVELGRMDDQRLGLHFFEEWKVNVLLGSGWDVSTTGDVAMERTQDIVTGPPPGRRKKKRRRSSSNSPTPAAAVVVDTSAPGAKEEQNPGRPPPLGSLSLHNCTIADETIGAMVESKMGHNLGVLDMTGINCLTNELLEQLLPTCPNLVRLSLKNCRRLTHKTVEILARHQQRLKFLDVGGSYNIDPQDLIAVVVPQLGQLVELHASGLAWTNESVATLTGMRAWNGLSFGFSMCLSATPLKDALAQVSSTLQMVALPFCENMVDNALLGALGRNLPNVICLDVRGNPGLTSLTGWYDGRESANLKPQQLVVLARYSGVSKSSLEETKRIHPVETVELVCVLDGAGVGAGIRNSE